MRTKARQQPRASDSQWDVPSFTEPMCPNPPRYGALVARTVSDFGRLDLAFNNAGADGQQVPLHEQDIGTTR